MPSSYPLEEGIRIKDMANLFLDIQKKIEKKESSFALNASNGVHLLMENKSNVSFGNLIIKPNPVNGAKDKLHQLISKRNLMKGKK